MRFYFLVTLGIAATTFHLFSQSSDTSSNAANNLVGQPRVAYQPPLQFPEMAREAGLQVTLYVKIIVGKDGKPYKTEIMKRDPEFVFNFDEEVQIWAMKFEFDPMKDKNGEPADFSVAIPVKFKLNNFEPPSILDQPQPKYPAKAVQMGTEGWVGLAILLDKNGLTKTKVLIVSRYPQNTNVFDDAAIDVAMNSTLSPATSKGNPINGWAFMKVEFKLPSK